MDARKVEKITALLISAIIVCLAFSENWVWHFVSIFAGSNMSFRFLYPFFHTNMFHALLNSWCLLSIIFIYDIGIGRLLSAYMIAVTVPVDTLGYFTPMDSPTVGLSGLVFALFGSISFEVLRKRYYQLWMLFYLVAGFLFPGINAVLHLWCYVLGLIMALLNKPVKIMHHER